MVEGNDELSRFVFFVRYASGRFFPWTLVEAQCLVEEIITDPATNHHVSVVKSELLGQQINVGNHGFLELRIFCRSSPRGFLEVHCSDRAQSLIIARKHDILDIVPWGLRREVTDSG